MRITMSSQLGYPSLKVIINVLITVIVIILLMEVVGIPDSKLYQKFADKTSSYEMSNNATSAQYLSFFNVT